MPKPWCGRVCDLTRDRYGFYTIGWSEPRPGQTDARLRSDLATAVGLALTQQNGVEGGIWQTEAGPLAYAFPTYKGTGPKTDLPTVERDKFRRSISRLRGTSSLSSAARHSARRRCYCTPARFPVRSAG